MVYETSKELAKGQGLTLGDYFYPELIDDDEDESILRLVPLASTDPSTAELPAEGEF